jgi:hypothetical protein
MAARESTPETGLGAPATAPRSSRRLRGEPAIIVLEDDGSPGSPVKLSEKKQADSTATDWPDAKIIDVRFAGASTKWHEHWDWTVQRETAKKLPVVFLIGKCAHGDKKHADVKLRRLETSTNQYRNGVAACNARHESKHPAPIVATGSKQGVLQ